MRVKTKKLMTGMLLAVLCVLAAVCTDVTDAQAAVKLNATSMNLCVGDTAKLTLNGTSKKPKWKSSAPKVVKVSQKGSVRALKAGKATVTATLNKKTYKCKFTVNKTFKVDQTAISIKNNTEVTAYLSVNGAVNASVANKKICSVTFGKWDGDYMPLTIVPKKVGTTTIKFTNSVNSESCTLKVTVKALPVNATFQTPAVNSGSDYFIVGENALGFAFRLNRAANSVAFKLYDEGNNVVRTYSLGKLAKDKLVSLSWDGCDKNGQPLNGKFTYTVVADGTKTVGGDVQVLGVSPFGKGDGSENNPFLVSDLAELIMVKDYNGSHFAQDAEIDFHYSSIGQLFSEETPFTGIYDGKYGNTTYQMSNFFGYNSIFGTIGETGTVRNVYMSNCVLNTTGSFLAFTNNGTIENCTVNGNVLCNAGNQAAMLVMYNKGQVRGCNASGKLTMSAAGAVGSTALRAGGIVMNNTGTVAECTSAVELVSQLQIGTYLATSVYEIYAGGIVAENAATGFVAQCTFTGQIDGEFVLPDALKDLTAIEAGKQYAGYVAGSNLGYISRCVNAGAAGALLPQGTGSGVVQ